MIIGFACLFNSMPLGQGSTSEGYIQCTGPPAPRKNTLGVEPGHTSSRNVFSDHQTQLTPIIPAKPLHNSDTVSVHFNHF